MTTKGFYINYYGDNTVGDSSYERNGSVGSINFDQEWEIHGEFSFANEDHQRQFEEALIQAFAFVGDEACLGITTFEERIQQREDEEEYFDYSDESWTAAINNI